MSKQRTTPTPTSPGSKTKKKHTRTRIVQAAHRLFIERGYHGTSMRQIAEQSGLALGGIYNHFAGKEDIFTTVMMEHNPYHFIIPALEAARGEAVEELVHDAATGMLAALGDHPDSLHLLFIEIVEFGGRHFPQLFENVFPQLMSFIQRLTQANGNLRPIPLPTLIRALMGFFFAYYMTEWLMGEQFPSQFQPEAFDYFMDIYLHGILAE